MFCWETDQPTLEDKEAEMRPRPKDGNNKNILQIDQTQ